MDKNDIIDYITKTPENSNPNMIREMLDELPSGGGDDGNFIVHITLDDWNEETKTYDTVIVDKTEDEIWDAVYEGKRVVGINPDTGIYEWNAPSFIKQETYYGLDNFEIWQAIVFPNGETWSYEEQDYYYDFSDFAQKGSILTINNNNELVFYDPELEPSEWEQVTTDDIEDILNKCANLYLIVYNHPTFWSVTEGFSVYPLLYFHNVHVGGEKIARVAFGKITIAPNEKSFEFEFYADEEDGHFALDGQGVVHEFTINDSPI